MGLEERIDVEGHEIACQKTDIGWLPVLFEREDESSVGDTVGCGLRGDRPLHGPLIGEEPIRGSEERVGLNGTGQEGLVFLFDREGKDPNVGGLAT